MTILGISGSLREHSFNTGLLRSAQATAPDGVNITIADLSAIPLYSGDLEEDGVPAAVLAFKDEIREADALLFATPEYNYSIPGVLKNVIDWASRPHTESPFAGKPAAVMGAGGIMGTVRAQLHFRQLASALNMLLLNRPEVLIQRANEKFHSDGSVKDPDVEERVAKLLAALVEWTELLKRGVAYEVLQ
jgi:chromate reductase, NAD(P)H dehydrogenase (quinone)